MNNWNSIWLLHTLWYCIRVMLLLSYCDLFVVKVFGVLNSSRCIIWYLLYREALVKGSVPKSRWGGSLISTHRFCLSVAKIYYFPKKENSLRWQKTLNLAWDRTYDIHCLLLLQEESLDKVLKVVYTRLFIVYYFPKNHFLVVCKHFVFLYTKLGGT